MKAMRRPSIAAQDDGRDLRVPDVHPHEHEALDRQGRAATTVSAGFQWNAAGAVELVTADGRLVRASETEEPELFWGVRGAGWNFGIVTAFEFGLHPFGPDLHRGVRVYPASVAHEGVRRVPRLHGQRAGHRIG